MKTVEGWIFLVSPMTCILQLRCLHRTGCSFFCCFWVGHSNSCRRTKSMPFNFRHTSILGFWWPIMGSCCSSEAHGLESGDFWPVYLPGFVWWAYTHIADLAVGQLPLYFLASDWPSSSIHPCHLWLGIYLKYEWIGKYQLPHRHIDKLNTRIRNSPNFQITTPLCWPRSRPRRPAPSSLPTPKRRWSASQRSLALFALWWFLDTFTILYQQNCGWWMNDSWIKKNCFSILVSTMNNNESNAMHQNCHPTQNRGKTWGW